MLTRKVTEKSTEGLNINPSVTLFPPYSLHDYISLPESDLADMAFLMKQIRTMLPVLGLDFLREQRKPKETTGQPVAEPETSPLFSMEIAKHGIRAQAQEVDGEFSVLAGSRARDQWTSSYASYQALHQQLTEDGVLVANEAGSVTFTKDQAFSSPSATAAAVSGRPANGRTTWKIDGDGLTYGEWQSEQVNAAVEETKSDG